MPRLAASDDDLVLHPWGILQAVTVDYAHTAAIAIVVLSNDVVHSTSVTNTQACLQVSTQVITIAGICTARNRYLTLWGKGVRSWVMG